MFAVSPDPDSMKISPSPILENSSVNDVNLDLNFCFPLLNLTFDWSKRQKFKESVEFDRTQKPCSKSKTSDLSLL